MAVLHSHDEMTAELVSPVLIVRLAVMNISVLRLSSPIVFLRILVMPIMIKAKTKPTPTTTALESGVSELAQIHTRSHILM